MADLEITTSDLGIEGLDYENVELGTSDFARQSVDLNTSELSTTEAVIETSDFSQEVVGLETVNLSETTEDLGTDSIDVVYSGFSPETEDYLKKFLEEHLGSAAWEEKEEFASSEDAKELDNRVGHTEQDLKDKVSKSESQPQPMRSTLRSAGSIEAMGIAAKGIADLSVSGGGGAGVGTVLCYDELTTSEPEDTSVVATAYSVAKIKEDIGLNDIEEFITNKPYERGDVVRYNGKGWRFVTNKEPGSWDPSYCEYLRYASLAKPLPIQISEIIELK